LDKNQSEYPGQDNNDRYNHKYDSLGAHSPLITRQAAFLGFIICHWFFKSLSAGNYNLPWILKTNPGKTRVGHFVDILC
jgi:hypothetical protein